MEINDKMIAVIQDHGSLHSALLVILEALETGDWPKTFALYHDTWITGVMGKIARVAKEKYGIAVPDSELY